MGADVRRTGRRVPRWTVVLAVGAVGAVVAGVLAGAGPATPAGADGNEAPSAPEPARALTGGGGHSCVITTSGASDGQVRCWGFNSSGQLGLADEATRGDAAGEMGSYLSRVPLGSGRTATIVSAGFSHSCAILDNARLKCWGANGSGRLGLGDTNDRGDAPGEMGGNLPAVDLGTGRTATAVAAGYAHTCAILDDATVRCWGDNASGRLGLADTNDRGDAAGEMGGNLPAVPLGSGRTATALTAGDGHTCAILDTGRVKCWGDNVNGQLGLGDTNDRGDAPGEMGGNLPAVDLGTGRTATAITAGYRHTCALLDDGSVKCWGWNGGWLGLEDNLDRGDGPGEMGDALPAVDLGAGRTATAISAGERHTCALLDDGSVKCWGGNTYGQLAHDGVNNIGDNAGEMGDDLPPIDLGTGRTATAVTTGAHHTCASLDDGATKCWGINVNGTLGQGDTVNRGSHAYDRGDDLDPIALPPRGLLTGTLADAVTGEAVVGGFVAVLRTADFSLAAAAITGPASDWEADVAPGGYFLYQVDPTARHLEGFLESVPGVPFLVEVGDGENVDLGALWITGPTRGSFSGTVTDDASGRPLAGAWVLAIGPAGLVGGAVTAADGTYTVTDLPVGTYRATFVDGEARRLQEYWDDSLTYDGGATLNVTAGGNTPGIDAALDRP